MEGTLDILHVDMDAFFASIEQLDQPKWRGRPVLVGYDGPRGVVAAASYEARTFGCRSAQPMAVARRLCPDAVITPVRRERYSEISARLFTILDDFSPCIEPLSIDEAFLDVRGTRRLLGSAEEIARALKDRVRQELSLTASVGVATNKFLAKLASDMEKPDGLTIIRTEDLDTEWFRQLPVTKIWGVGPATAARMARLGITTIEQLQTFPRDVLQQQFGREANRYLDLARGIDSRSVTPDSEAKSIGHEQTFDTNLADPKEVQRVLLGQVEQVGRRLRRHDWQAGGVSLKIRYGDFQTISRSTALGQPTDTTRDLWRAAESLFATWATTSFQPVRLIGMTATRLQRPVDQFDLFPDGEHDRQKRIDRTTDVITDRFGKHAIRRGGTLGN